MLKNEHQIGRRPIKKILCLLFNFVENEHQIGRRPIEEEIIFFI